MNCKDCDKKAIAQGYCRNHYYQARRKGLIYKKQEHNKERQKCEIKDCNRISFAREMCSKHYKRARRRGFQPEPELDKSQWTLENIAWIAGVIEGEGCFHCKEKYTYRIRVRMTDFDVIYKLQEITKIGVINGPYQRKENSKWKPFLEWSVSKRKEVIELCKAIEPWMCKRRKEKIDYIMKEYKKCHLEDVKRMVKKGGHGVQENVILVQMQENAQ